MEASKCPKCGEEPFFIEQVEKWYCYGCNEYIEGEQEQKAKEKPKAETPERAGEDHTSAIADELKALEEEDEETCKTCGATLDEITPGKLYCFICERYPDEKAVQPEPEKRTNEAQSLLEMASTPVVKASAFETRPEPEIRKVPLAEIKMCATCGKPLKYIDKYQRFYCYGCRKYAPKGEHARPQVVPTPKPTESVKKCPDCGGNLTYVEKYKEHYCYSCKKYPFHKKAQRAETPAKKKVLVCPKCGGELKWIEKYSRYYCFPCKDYAPKDFGEVGRESKSCPTCSEDMKYVQEYNEWYCYKCKKYSLRPQKPILLF